MKLFLRQGLWIVLVPVVMVVGFPVWILAWVLDGVWVPGEMWNEFPQRFEVMGVQEKENQDGNETK